MDNENERKSETPQDENILDDHSNEMSKLIIMQFTVQHLALEVSAYLGMRLLESNFSEHFPPN